MIKKRSTLVPRVRGMVEWQLEHYPEDVRRLDKAKLDLIPSPVAKMSLNIGGGSSGAHRSTEDIAMDIATNQYIRHLEISCAAIKRVVEALGKEDLKLVDLVFWRKEFTIEGAGMVIGMSRACAYRHINDILTDIAREMGYVSQ